MDMEDNGPAANDEKRTALVFAPVRDHRRRFEAELKRAGLVTRDLNKPNQTVWVLRHGDRVLGFVALEAYGSLALLRSLIVPKEARGNGIGRQLVARAVQLARELRFKELWLATEDAEAYFRALGWQSRPRSDIPPSLAKTAEFASTGRVVMSLALDSAAANEAVAISEAAQ
ncbi:MAG: GNAT family N-acetyltransferase [Asticcacaulis sp.]|nr:GNAT family N-acetyltransferase [Asticcacaulis sp.]